MRPADPRRGLSAPAYRRYYLTGVRAAAWVGADPTGGLMRDLSLAEALFEARHGYTGSAATSAWMDGYVNSDQTPGDFLREQNKIREDGS